MQRPRATRFLPRARWTRAAAAAAAVLVLLGAGWAARAAIGGGSRATRTTDEGAVVGAQLGIGVLIIWMGVTSASDGTRTVVLGVGEPGSTDASGNPSPEATTADLNTVTDQAAREAWTRLPGTFDVLQIDVGTYDPAALRIDPVHYTAQQLRSMYGERPAGLDDAATSGRDPAATDDLPGECVPLPPLAPGAVRGSSTTQYCDQESTGLSSADLGPRLASICHQLDTTAAVTDEPVLGDLWLKTYKDSIRTEVRTWFHLGSAYAHATMTLSLRHEAGTDTAALGCPYGQSKAFTKDELAALASAPPNASGSAAAGPATPSSSSPAEAASTSGQESPPTAAQTATPMATRTGRIGSSGDNACMAAFGHLVDGGLHHGDFTVETAVSLAPDAQSKDLVRAAARRYEALVNGASVSLAAADEQVIAMFSTYCQSHPDVTFQVPQPAPLDSSAPTEPGPGVPNVPATATRCNGGNWEGHVGAGPGTSCDFANAVNRAWQDAGYGTRTVEATSPVTGQTYQMSCVTSADLSEAVVCRGGNGAVVYLY